MSLPASAKRNWISTNTRRICGCEWQEARKAFIFPFHSEARLLALGKQRDGQLHLPGIQPQALHHAARRGNLALRDATIGLGHMPHEAKPC